MNVKIKHKRKFPELYTVAMDISEETIKMINKKARGTKSEAMFKEQIILERVVLILKDSI